MALLSNAAMYHKTWATFVDSAISKHHQNTDDGGAGNSSDSRVGSGRIDVQDVMRVEEILARIERAEGGWIDYERRPDGDDGADADASSLASGSLLRSSGRKSLDTLPPMFQNPGPSFLASMYNPAPVQANGGKDRPLPNDVKASRSGAKERSYAQDNLPVVGDSCAVSSSRSDGLGSVDAAKDDQLCSSQTTVGRGDGTAFEYEGRRQCLESRPGGPETKTEQRPIGRDDLSELMESLHLDGTESKLSTPPPVRGRSEETGYDLHREAHQPVGAEAQEGTTSATSNSDLFGRNLSPAAAYKDEEMFAVAQDRTQGGSNGGGEEVACLFEHEEEEKGEVPCVAASSSGTTPLRPDLFPEDVLMSQLSACLDATRIEGEETAHGGTTGAAKDEEEEEQSPLYASSKDKLSMIGGVTVVHASPRGVGKSGASFSEDEEEHLRGAVLSVERSGVMVGVTVLEGSGYGDSGSGSSRTDLSGEVVAAATAAALVEEGDDVLGAVGGAVDESQCALVPTPLAGSISSSSAPVYDGAAAAAMVIPSAAECCRRSPLQLEFERKVSAAGKGRNGDALMGERQAGADDDDLSDGDRRRFVGSTLHAPDKLLRLLSSPVGNDPTPASVSAPAAGLTSGRPSPHHEPSSQGDALLECRAQAGDNARVDEQAESPEILRLGPASPNRESMIRRERRPSFDRGSWEVRDVSGDPHGGGVLGNNGASFALARSPGGASTRGARQGQRLGSMLSPDTEGIGFLDGSGGVSSLSPFVLAGSLDAGEIGDAGYGSDNGGGWALPPGGGDGDCDLSPVRSATSETTDDVPSPPQGSGTPPSVLPRSREDMSEDGDTTLTPEVAPRLSSSESPFVVRAGSRLGEEERGDPGCGSVDASIQEARSTHKQADSGSLMPPPPPRHPSFSPRRTASKHRERAFSVSRETPEERCATQSSAADTRVAPLRTALGDRTNAPPRGRCDERSDEEESLPVSTRDGGRYDGGGSGARGCGGDRRGGLAEYSEQASIDSFSESEPERSKPGAGAKEAGADEDMTGDSSLAEGTPRRRGPGARDCSLGGFYPPLQVANLANKAREGSTLSTLQKSTLQWMLWRERGEKGGRSAAAAEASVSDDDGDDAIDIKGGLLGHLPSEAASACLHALVRSGVTFNDGDGSGRKVGSRARRTHTGTGLPCGPTLILAPTKEAAWRWSDRLESGSGGLSVLSYVMPLRERRRLSAKQVAAFDVVVTTYDVLKVKEVPRGVEAKEATSPRSWALPGSTQWRTRNAKEGGQKRTSASSKTDHMVSLLHGVWWDRVVADGAQILATQRSARAVAALALMGTARWCLVDCESMSIVEDASERMRCLAAFLRVPAAVPLVEVAESLFFKSRPRHIAPLYPRAPGAADNSLSLTEGDDSSGCSQRHRRRSSRGVNTRWGGGAGLRKGGSGREGRPSEEGKRLSTMEQVGDGGGGWGALPMDGGRSQRTSHAKTRGRGGRREGSQENGERGHDGGGGRRGEGDGGGAASGRQFSRRDVNYVPSRLTLRRARGEAGSMQVGQK